MDTAENKYKDIYYLEHHEPDPNKHPRMSRANRAAQFAPFAALSGFEESIKSASQQTTKKQQ